MTEPVRRRVAESVEGTSSSDLGIGDWAQLVLVGAIFGSAFLWIALSLRSFAPETIAFGRVALGASALAVVPAARCRIEREDWPRLVVASVVGIATPTLLFGLAEERISSALAGMLVSGLPIIAAIVTAVETRELPRRERLAGLGLGLVGIGLLTGPALSDLTSQGIGVGLVLIAVVCYAVATTLYAPLQQTYGSLRVTLWVLVVSTMLLAPLGLFGLRASTPQPIAVFALLILGILGTGVVWTLFVTLVGRVGAVRSSIAGYLIPVFALVLGVVVLDETVESLQVLGVGVALSGAYLISKRPPQAVPRELGGDSAYIPPALEMCR